MVLTQFQSDGHYTGIENLLPGKTAKGIQKDPLPIDVPLLVHTESYQKPTRYQVKQTVYTNPIQWLETEGDQYSYILYSIHSQ